MRKHLKGRFEMMTKKETRKALRALKPYTGRLEFRKNIVMKTHNGYAVMNTNDHDDPMHDYDAWVYGFGENYLLDMLLREGDIVA